MARTHAKLLCSIWQDPDFTSLSTEAQRLYLLIISQPKLSLCGAIDYVPARWARCGPGMTADDIEVLADELERRRYVIIDRDQTELLVRSFVRNDGICARWQMVSAMWSAWEALASERLADAVLRELPDEAWCCAKAPAPEAAIANRAAMRLAIECDPEHLHLQLQPSSAEAGLPFDSLREQLRGRGE